MASFQVTGTPTSLTVAPGKSAVIAVVVSNLQGRPVMARVDMMVTPPTAAAWFTLAGAAQRKFGADPTTTERFEFTVAVPATAATKLAQTIQFRPDAVDVLSPDDHFQQGEIVAVTVPPAAEVAPTPAVPWWIWLVAAAVVIGVGVGIYFAVGRNRVPNVVGESLASAEATLKTKGFTVVAPTYVLDSELVLDRDQVVSQTPAAGSAHQETDTVAQLTVKRRTVAVPEVIGKTLGEAANLLGQAGLILREPSISHNSPPADDGRVQSIAPAQGALAGVGDTIQMVVASKDPPCEPWPACRRTIFDRLRVRLNDGVVLRRIPQ